MILLMLRSGVDGHGGHLDVRLVKRSPKETNNVEDHGARGWPE
ncbi:MAG: hypothetical protein R3C59_05730 [Planctomycetaceae bacterium]